MSNSTTLLDTIATNQANKEVVVNALLDAASPSMLWGRHASACSGLTWGYYGGTYYEGGTANAIANGTVTLTASTTNYVYANATTGAVSANTSGFPGGAIPLYTVTTNATTVTAYTDDRSYQPSATASTASGTVTSVGVSMPGIFSVAGSPITTNGTIAVTFSTQAANTALMGPTSGAAAAPTFRALVGADIPVFVASGASHAPGGVPDPGASAGTAKFLREDSTWAVPPTGGGGSVTSGANFGTGTGQVFDSTDSTSTTLAFKTIKAGSNITITNNAQDVTIAASGGSTPIGLTSGTGYPTASGTVGDIYRATDGALGRELFSYVGAFTGLPTVVNAGVAAVASTGAVTVTMERAITTGNLLVAFGGGNGLCNLTANSGWTSIFSNSTPSYLCPAAAYQVIASGGATTVSPFTTTNSNGSVVHVVEIAHANASPIAASFNGNASSYTIASPNNLLLAFQGGPQSGGVPIPKGSVFCGETRGPSSGMYYPCRLYALPLAASMIPGTVVDTSLGASNYNLTCGVEIAASSGTTQYWKTLG